MTFDQPGQGIHSIRFCGLALVDVVLTVLAAWALARWTKKPFCVVLLGLFLAGIVAHHVFGVRTAVDRALFH